ncbi:MAG: galactosyldiacylglycerol synthase [Peptococcaceae bacterium]|nr:galactosyldiacylglycerol synthase [Peptococcaceae bacterium]
MKVLFLPFLKIPTGHHTVADALIRSLERRISSVRCSKIDFFSYADKLLEKAFRVTYLTWIDHSPQTFVWLYRNFVYPSKSTKHFNWYEIKFLDKMKDLIQEEQPDLIVCTQAFPSFLINRLRFYGITTPPVVNVYTDFFVNKLWGIEGIDYHFVPDQTMKSQLVAKYNINPNRVIITGIPIDECFHSPTPYHSIPPYHILISGGSGGLGDIENLITSLPQDKNYYFSLLCGNNKKLYKDVFSLKKSNLKPLSYISSRDTMNALYNQAHAIITKPGGVTLSEALCKRLPIFIHSALPGQEEVNMEYLYGKKLIYPLDVSAPIVDQLDFFFREKDERLLWQQRTDAYMSEIECPAWKKITELLLTYSLSPQKYHQPATATRSTS